jgi:hypothetical protein
MFPVDLRGRLQQGASVADIRCIAREVRNNAELGALYCLLFDKDYKIACRAAWILIRVAPERKSLLDYKVNGLIAGAIGANHACLRRLLLSLIYERTLSPHLDLLKFCIERSVDIAEQPAVRAICLKILYKICRPHLEFRKELALICRQLRPTQQPPAMQASCRNVTKNLYKIAAHSPSLQRTRNSKKY